MPFANENFGVTHYYDADGNEITLNQGKTWVCIVLDSYSDNVSVYSGTASDTGCIQEVKREREKVETVKIIWYRGLFWRLASIIAKIIGMIYRFPLTNITRK